MRVHDVFVEVEMINVFDFADLPALPFVIAGGVVLMMTCGAFVSASVLLAGFIKRRRKLERDRKNS